MKYFIYILIASTIALHQASAIVIRHDINDQNYLALAEQYSPSVAYVGGCAATLIEPTWLLTAAHCVEGKETSLFRVRHLEKPYRIASIIVHPSFTRTHDENHDIALVQLKDPILTGQPVKLNQVQNELNLPVVFVGRGTYGNGQDGLIRDDYQQRAATNTVDAVTEQVIGFTFNDPQNATELEGISSRGDSGGPAFIKQNNQLYVIGVSSYQDGRGYPEGHYGVGEYYTRVSTYYPWLSEIILQTPAAKVTQHELIVQLQNNDLAGFERLLDSARLPAAPVLEELFYQAVLLDRPAFATALIQHGVQIENVRIHTMSVFEFVLLEKRKDLFKQLQSHLTDRQRLHHPDSAVLPRFIAVFKDDPYLLIGATQLIKQGANLNAQSSGGDTALIVAGWNTSNLELVRLLVDQGANINLANNNGDTPSMDAAYLGKIQNLQLFIKNGADLSLKNKRGNSALDLAKRKQHQDVIDLLTTHTETER